MGTYRIEKWPNAPAAMAPELRKDFAEHAGDARVGNELIFETPRVRVWSIRLKPGERLGFHTHVLDYFWTSVTGGHGRSHFNDGRVEDITYKPGDVKQRTFKEGELMVHDLENVGDTDLLFTTVEFIDSPNAPLALRDRKR
jgi:quercetin dioxygenase-like cupin family protein